MRCRAKALRNTQTHSPVFSFPALSPYAGTAHPPGLGEPFRGLGEQGEPSAAAAPGGATLPATLAGVQGGAGWKGWSVGSFKVEATRRMPGRRKGGRSGTAG